MTSAVSLHYISDSIAILKIEDLAHQNEFTPELGGRLRDVFKTIEDNSSLKVLILAGYDKFFLNGAHKETVLGVIEGRLIPNNEEIFALPLQCQIPTIAAMEGNALAGGLCFGLFADIIIMAEESRYCAPFMQYGFTPGNGSTYILPKKLGNVLGTEMLLTADFYKGKEIQSRGAGVMVLKKEEVLKKAIKIAKGLSICPRPSLLLLKEQMTEDARTALPKFFEQETKMQETTFRLPEVQEMIKHYMH